MSKSRIGKVTYYGSVTTTGAASNRTITFSNITSKASSRKGTASGPITGKNHVSGIINLIE